MAASVDNVELRVPENYSYIIALNVFILMQCYLTGFFFVHYYRNVIFSQKFVDQHFLEEHKKAFKTGSYPSFQGYPDSGSGRFSEKLPFHKWYEFNRRQNVHAGFLEVLTPIVFASFLGGFTSVGATIAL